MARRASRRLVVDTSIASAAGESPSLEAAVLREVLKCILSKNHRVVMTSPIFAEWHKHASAHALKWLVKMQDLGNVETIDLGKDSSLRERIREKRLNSGVVQAMLKDLHLIEAAFATDRIVISLDEKARRYFAQASSIIDELGEILWANPVFKKERVVAWLNNGAKPQKSRQLGYRKR
jgi:hypothetical protein